MNFFAKAGLFGCLVNGCVYKCVDGIVYADVFVFVSVTIAIATISIKALVAFWRGLKRSNLQPLGYCYYFSVSVSQFSPFYLARTKSNRLCSCA